MTLGTCWRPRRAAICWALALLVSASCYRAELDLTPFLDQNSAAGAPATSMGEAGQAASGGTPGESDCDDTPDTQEQWACRTERLPTRAECFAQDLAVWQGCHGGCSVCTENAHVRGYPYYFDWHPCCLPYDACSNNEPQHCSAGCPAPTDHDKVRPCFVR